MEDGPLRTVRCEAIKPLYLVAEALLTSAESAEVLNGLAKVSKLEREREIHI